MSATVRYYDYIIINFDDVLKRTTVDVVNYFDEYGQRVSKLGRDFKKVFIHFFIKRLCDQCLSIKGPFKRILFCNPGVVSKKLELFDVIDYNEFVTFMSNTLNEMGKFLPLVVFFSTDVRFDDINESNDCNDLKFDFDAITNSSNSRKSLRNLVQYANQLGLNLLGKDYSEKLNVKKMYI